MAQNKSIIKVQLENETIGKDFLSATVNDIKRVYQKAQSILDGNDMIAKRAIINNFLNKVVVKKTK